MKIFGRETQQLIAFHPNNFGTLRRDKHSSVYIGRGALAHAMDGDDTYRIVVAERKYVPIAALFAVSLLADQLSSHGPDKAVVSLAAGENVVTVTSDDYIQEVPERLTHGERKAINATFPLGSIVGEDGEVWQADNQRVLALGATAWRALRQVDLGVQES